MVLVCKVNPPLVGGKRVKCGQASGSLRRSGDGLLQRGRVGRVGRLGAAETIEGFRGGQIGDC